MPYYHEEPMLDKFVKTTPSFLNDVEELQLSLIRMQQEKETWKNKCQTLEMSYQTELKEKDDLIEILKSRDMEMMEKQGDLFSSRAQSDLVAHFLTMVIGKKSPSGMQRRTSN